MEDGRKKKGHALFPQATFPFVPTFQVSGDCKMDKKGWSGQEEGKRMVVR